MTDRDSPVTTDELHAYVDGMLPADRTGAVEAWLAIHPEDAARVAEWRALSDALHQRYGSIADEPVPARFDLAKLARSRPPWRAIAAAALLAAVIGGAAGWIGRAASTPAPSSGEIITADALSAHKLYIAEVRHPIEVKAAEKHLIPWLSKRVGTTLRIPDLNEYSLQLLGGRLLPGPIGPAALFMYESPSGERFTIYCSRSKKMRMALRYQSGGEIAAMHWVESEIGYVVSGPDDRGRLAKIAQTAYEQMENPPARGAQFPLISRRKGS
ncbi:MAG: anti-sigma factor [Rhizobiales bacterium]|nr:anti-sigma factor [Hyphomicrobiales bacterium]